MWQNSLITYAPVFVVHAALSPRQQLIRVARGEGQAALDGATACRCSDARGPRPGLGFRVLDDLDEGLDRAIREAVRGEGEGEDGTRREVGRVRELRTTEWAFKRVVPVSAAAMHGCEAPFQDAQGAE